MNTQAHPLPGYIVEAKDPSGSKRTVTSTFTHLSLLTARQNAIHYAQELQARPMRTYPLHITIRLAEIEKNIIPNRHTVICEVFNQRFGPNLVIPQDKPKQIGMTVEADCPLPSSVNLTMDLTKDDQAFNSPKAIWNSLGEMTCEYEYYRSQDFDTGFGYVVLNLEGPNKQLPQIKNLSALSDEQINERLATLRQPKPYRFFFLLQDSLVHAGTLISRYNHEYADDEGLLSFSLDFITP